MIDMGYLSSIHHFHPNSRGHIEYAFVHTGLALVVKLLSAFN